MCEVITCTSTSCLIFPASQRVHFFNLGVGNHQCGLCSTWCHLNKHKPQSVWEQHWEQWSLLKWVKVVTWFPGSPLSYDNSFSLQLSVLMSKQVTDMGHVQIERRHYKTHCTFLPTCFLGAGAEAKLDCVRGSASFNAADVCPQSCYCILLPWEQDSNNTHTVLLWCKWECWSTAIVGHGCLCVWWGVFEADAPGNTSVGDDECGQLIHTHKKECMKYWQTCENPSCVCLTSL